MKLPKEIIEHLTQEVLEDGERPEEAIGKLEETVDIFKNFKIAEEDNWGGEGEGSSIGYVYKFTNKETQEENFLMFSGYYESNNGSEWGSNYGGNIMEVEPYQKTERDWKEVK